ncbi:MAG: energy transducer TonB [Bacteroidales bacterium]|nr:energy transducer TonB [Bacteroidales bacterium]
MVLLRDPGFPAMAGIFESVPVDRNDHIAPPYPTLAPDIWQDELIGVGTSEDTDIVDDGIPSTSELLAEEDAVRFFDKADGKATASDIPADMAQSTDASLALDTFTPALAKKEAVTGSASREAAVAKGVPVTQEASLINAQTGSYQSMTAPSSDQTIFNTESITFTLAEPKVVFTVAEQMPSFPGGPPALQAYLDREIKLPSGLVFWSGDTLIVAEVVIDEQGRVRQPQIVQGINKDVDNLVRKALRRMPSWDPGKNRGIPVTVKTLVPVRLKGKSAQ